MKKWKLKANNVLYIQLTTDLMDEKWMSVFLVWDVYVMYYAGWMDTDVCCKC